MNRYLYCAVTLGLVSIVMSLRAADQPHAGAGSRNKAVWTNNDLEKLHSLGLVSIVGRPDGEEPKAVPAAGPYLKTDDQDWYAVQAAQLNDKLERRKAKLCEYEQAIDDARSLRKTTGGVNLDAGDFAITPEVGIEILEQHLDEVQMEINALEDLARRHDIPPGALRGQ
jgi:hypothetical protein